MIRRSKRRNHDDDYDNVYENGDVASVDGTNRRRKERGYGQHFRGNDDYVGDDNDDEEYQSIMKRCRITSTPGELRLIKDVKEVRATISNVLIEFTDQPSVILIRFPFSNIEIKSSFGSSSYIMGEGHMSGHPEAMAQGNFEDEHSFQQIHQFQDSLPSVFAVAVSKFYPHACPEVKCLDYDTRKAIFHGSLGYTGDGVTSWIGADGTLKHPLLSDHWSALFGLRDVVIMLIGIREMIMCSFAENSSTSGISETTGDKVRSSPMLLPSSAASDYSAIVSTSSPTLVAKWCAPMVRSSSQSSLTEVLSPDGSSSMYGSEFRSTQGFEAETVGRHALGVDYEDNVGGRMLFSPRVRDQRDQQLFGVPRNQHDLHGHGEFAPHVYHGSLASTDDYSFGEDRIMSMDNDANYGEQDYPHTGEVCMDFQSLGQHLEPDNQTAMMVSAATSDFESSAAAPAMTRVGSRGRLYGFDASVVDDFSSFPDCK